MSKGVLKIAKVSIQNSKLAYWIPGIFILMSLPQSIIYLIIFLSSGEPHSNSTVSAGCMLWLIPLLAAVFIPTTHFHKIINLGGRRDNFILGSLAVYIFMTFSAALANTVIFYTFDLFYQGSGFSTGVLGGIMNLIEIFGWKDGNIVTVFARQFALLFLITSFVHTLTAMQDKWYGWAADIAIAVFIAVCTPIAALRPALLGLLNLIVFQQNAFAQIAVCFVLGFAIYALNKPIFARKAI